MNEALHSRGTPEGDGISDGISDGARRDSVAGRGFAEFLRRRRAAKGAELTEEEIRAASAHFETMHWDMVVRLAGEDPADLEERRTIRAPERGRYSRLQLFKYLATWLLIGGTFSWSAFVDGNRILALIWIGAAILMAGAILWHAAVWPFRR